MMNYNPDDNTLEIKQVKDLIIPVTPMEAQKQSYNKYIKETIFSDMTFLETKIKEITNTPSFILTPMLPKKWKSPSTSEVKSWGIEHYAVSAHMETQGYHVPEAVELLHIPAMDDYCVLNCDGQKKILYCQLVNEENISFEAKAKDKTGAKSLVIAGEMNSFKITAKTNIKSPIKFEVYKRSFDYNDVIDAFRYRDSVSEDLSKIFTNPYLVTTLSKSDELIPVFRQAHVENSKVLDYLKGDAFKIGNLRSVLNARLSIDKCIGMTTSRDIDLRLGGTISKGTVITDEVLKLLKRNLVNTVHVRTVHSSMRGLKIHNPIIINHVPRGTAVTDYVIKLFPKYKSYSYIPEDIELSTPIVIPEGAELDTTHMIQFIYDCGIEQIKCRIKKDTTANTEIVKTFTFEQEFVGNYTMRKCDFLNTNSEEYVYYYGLDDPYNSDDYYMPDRLMAWDIIALISMLARICTMPELAETFNRDVDFLKKVNMANETFSTAFRKAAVSFVTKYRKNIAEYINGKSTNPYVFKDLNTMWKKNLQDTKLLQKSKDVNPISLLDQANKVVTSVGGKNSHVDADRRSLAIGYYGRLCPYNTPSGKQTGLVNTLAVGCSVKDGRLSTFYRVIDHSSGRARLTEDVISITALEGLKYKIGDVMSLKLDKDNYIINSKVPAFIPFPLDSREKIRVASYDSSDLDLVNISATQHLSPAAMLIPFAAADDSIRLQFGINLISQSIYVQSGEVPLTSTSMYKKMFDYGGGFVYKAEHDGVVTYVDKDIMYVMYDGSASETQIHLNETQFLNEATISLNYKFRIGEHFKQGDVLVDSPVSRDGYFSPGANVFAAYMPWMGYNYEDGVVISNRMAHKFVSITTDVEEHSESTKGANVNVSRCNYFNHIEKGKSISALIKTDSSNKTITTESQWKSKKSEGTLYAITTESKRLGQKTFRAHMLSFNETHIGDKMSGRHGNKGVVNLVEEDKNMPVFLNGEQIEILLNPCGIPSRMNPGQLDDANAGFIAYLLGVRIISEPFNGASLADLHMLMEFVYDMSNTDDIDVVFRKYPDIPNELKSRAKDRYTFMQKWRGCFYANGTAPLYNPTTGKLFYNPIGFGIPYFLKIHQEVDDKQDARAGALNEEYQALSSQPTEGAKRNGGQKTGEMEFAGLLAHGAAGFIDECVNEKSDNVGRRVNALQRSLGNNDYIAPEETCPRTVDNLRYFLEACGVKMEISNYPDITSQAIKKRFKYRGMFVLRAAGTPIKSSKVIPIDCDDDTADMILRMSGRG